MAIGVQLGQLPTADAATAAAERWDEAAKSGGLASALAAQHGLLLSLRPSKAAVTRRRQRIKA